MASRFPSPMKSEIESQLSSPRHFQKNKTKRHNGFIEAAPDPTFVVDDNARIVQVNDRALSLLGYARQDIIRTNIDSIIPGIRKELRIHNHGEDFFNDPISYRLGANAKFFGLTKSKTR